MATIIDKNATIIVEDADTLFEELSLNVFEYSKSAANKFDTYFKHTVSSTYLNDIIKRYYSDRVVDKLNGLKEHILDILKEIVLNATGEDFFLDEYEIQKLEKLVDDELNGLTKESINKSSNAFLEVFINISLSKGVITEKKAIKAREDLVKVLSKLDDKLLKISDKLFEQFKKKIKEKIRNKNFVKIVDYKDDNYLEKYKFACNLVGDKLINEDGKLTCLFDGKSSELEENKGHNIYSLDKTIGLISNGNSEKSINYYNSTKGISLSVNSKSIALYDKSKKLILMISFNDDVSFMLNGSVISGYENLDTVLNYLATSFPNILDYLLINEKFKKMYGDITGLKKKYLALAGFNYLDQGLDEHEKDVYIDSINGNYYVLRDNKLKCLNKDIEDINFLFSNDSFTLVDDGNARKIYYNTITGNIRVFTTNYSANISLEGGEFIGSCISKDDYRDLGLVAAYNVVNNKFPNIIRDLEQKRGAFNRK